MHFFSYFYSRLSEAALFYWQVAMDFVVMRIIVLEIKKKRDDDDNADCSSCLNSGIPGNSSEDKESSPEKMFYMCKYG